MTTSSSLKTRIATLLALAAAFSPLARAQTKTEPGNLHLEAAGIKAGSPYLIMDPAADPYPYTQAAVKQGTAQALQGPDPKVPYFTVRYAMPEPPNSGTKGVAQLTGIDAGVLEHVHSPGFEILPNGDALAIYFSTPEGDAEAANTTSFVQARLRYGSDEWDMPELYFKTKGQNDQSGLLWQDGKTLWFFGGGRGLDWMPFRMTTSTDNGATWTMTLPQLDAPAKDFTAQPITSAFRGPDGAIYFAMDAEGSKSFLWRSMDNGVHWHDMGGRTDARHSPVVALDNQGNLLSVGGKSTSINGYTPQTVSKDWGATWSDGVASPFPALNSGQRASLIKLADGNLVFATDTYNRKADLPPPDGWAYGKGCVVAISTDKGATWKIKRLPVELSYDDDGKSPTLGYTTVRQAPNGVIHVLSTKTHPCLDYEFNEAWLMSDAKEVAVETTGGTVKKYSENYANGKERSEWSARTTPGGRYLLDGLETDYYDNGKKEHEVTYANGRKTGDETYWAPDGTKQWSWTHDLKTNKAVWTHYWPNGLKRNESTWDSNPKAHDIDRKFAGYMANGPVYQWKQDGTPEFAYNFVNGFNANELPLPKAQTK